MKHDALHAQLQATYATLQAAGQQVLAMMVALEEKDGVSEEPQCPKCGSTEVVEAGWDELGRQAYVCVCTNNFTAGDEQAAMTDVSSS